MGPARVAAAGDRAFRPRAAEAAGRAFRAAGGGGPDGAGATRLPAEAAGRGRAPAG